MYDIIVIGGGAAGMLASCVAADCGARVLLLEKNEKVGKKLFITGKGRCNLTNNCSAAEVLENIPTGNRFLFGAMNGFDPGKVIALFESLGVALKTERGGRVFPASDKSSDIIAALKRYMSKTGVVIKHDSATGIVADNGKVVGVNTNGGVIDCHCAVLATGGKSYSATGSTGDGFDFATALGHSITEIRGSLVPLIAEFGYNAQLQGLTLKNVKLSVFDGGKKPIFSDLGEMLFTHFGLSGPLVLSASAHMRDYRNKQYYVVIDLKPALDEKKLDLRILRDFEKYSNRDFSNALGDLLIRSMIPVIIKRTGIPDDIKVHSITREQRLTLGQEIKAFRIDIDGPGSVEEAIITSGGITTNEINPKSMESKLVNDLYFAGEIIDADAYTGGFNLQIAWATAYAAGKSAGTRYTNFPKT